MFSPSTTVHLKGDGQAIDMKQLISFDLGFNKLGLALGDIFNRLAALESGSPQQPSSSSVRGIADPVGNNNNNKNLAASVSNRDPNDLIGRVADLENKLAGLQQNQDDSMARSKKRSIDALGGTSVPKEEHDNDNDAPAPVSDQLDFLHRELDQVRELAKRANDKAGDAEHKADSVADRLDSHLRFAHGNDNNNDAEVKAPQQLPAGDSSVKASGNNNNNNNMSQRPDASMSSNPQQLAEDQHRLQAAVDRIAKQNRENADALENLGAQVRAIQRQQSSLPSSRGGGGGSDENPLFSKSVTDLSKRVSALEEDNRNTKEQLQRSVPASRVHRPSSTPSEETASSVGGGAGGSKIDDAIEQIKAHLTSHDVAIEDLQRQAGAVLTSMGSSGDDSGVPKDVLTAAVAGLQNRVKGAEDRVKDHDQQLQDLAGLKRTAAQRDQVEEIAKNLDYLTKATHNVQDKLSDKIDALENKIIKHIADPKHVDEAEFERLQNDVRRLEKDLMNLANNSSGHGAGGKSASDSGINEVAASMMRNKIDALQKALDDLTNKLSDLDNHVRNDVANQIADTNNTVKQNTSRIVALEGMTRRVADEAAHAAHDARTAGEAVDGILKRLSQLGNGQDHINDRLNQIDHSVTTLAAQSMANRGLGSSVGGGAGGGGSSKVEEALRSDIDRLKKWAQDRDAMANPNNLQKSLEADRDTNKTQIVDIKAIIDHIHHTKADASQVASKADRDYVENALEKLMREVENVINSTNAGLIDTLDKSLGLLRDMIDGKATKQDVAKVRNMIGASDMGGNSANAGGDASKSISGGGAGGGSGDGNAPVFDGLMGVYSYRCLGCNRTVDGMRARPMGGTMSNFMARNPPAGGSNSGNNNNNNVLSSSSNRATTPRAAPSQQQQQPLLIPAPPSNKLPVMNSSV